MSIAMVLDGFSLGIAVFCGDFSWTLEAVENILKNCMEHTPEGGAITIKAVDNNIYLGIIIENTGKGENQVEALAGVLFAVNQGEFVAIIGFSGSGKSTLLHILGGVDRPASGKVFVNGIDVYEQKEEQLAIFRRREVGLIYQFYNLISVLDVTENITLPVLTDGRKVNESRLEELLEILKLKGREKHLPNQLSGGQQQSN